MAEIGSGGEQESDGLTIHEQRMFVALQPTKHAYTHAKELSCSTQVTPALQDRTKG